ncbi:MAG: hypothetical protein AVDCRST_MAG50-2696 [uncultured Acidimicrobiales bacterium]|uniref:ACT domain-containing protein n=1 Tax=uncultured Acidimicrobiales bacterium TaxID=310071 RepID=A0A6J4IRQ3_9ACTN|nr:MAG: hypothetical protein AVDCRST_MAG50-2696 [uncultured Acidimicrobiales bacterium]
MPLVAMRVELVDEPNAMARIAAALGAAEVNIVDIDVHELDGSHVCDELVLDMPDRMNPGGLRQVLVEAGATSVLSVPFDQRRMDAVVRCLDAILATLHADAEDQLTAAICGLVPVDELEIRSIDELGGLDPDGSRLRAGTPVARRVDIDGRPRWVLALPITEGERAESAVLVARIGLRFSATEIARLRSVLRLHQHLSRAGALRS